jgi:N-acetylglucosaminyldiphosphoundecaprenol N-acetyl-beta-D-mannosaminyltransferase
LLSGIKQDRVAGMDMLPDLLSACEEEQLPVFIYGGTNSLIDKTRTYISERYATLPVAGMYSPPFRELTSLEDQEVVDKINASHARVVFVVLGCPKQEKWMAAMKGKINAVMIGIGGALPVLVGMQKRAPKWIQDSGFEWIFRLAQDPRRLARRYVFTNSIFVYLLLSRKIRNLVTRRKRTKFIPPNESDGRYFEKLA